MGMGGDGDKDFRKSTTPRQGEEIPEGPETFVPRAHVPFDYQIWQDDANREADVFRRIVTGLPKMTMTMNLL